MSHDRWTIVWSDELEINIILAATIGTFEKMREEFNNGSLKFKTPFLEYSTGNAIQRIPLEFEKEIVLLEKLKVFDRKSLLEEVDKRKYFKPFVAMLEGRFHPTIHMPEMIRAELQFLINQNCLDTLREEAEQRIQYKNWQLVNLYEPYFVYGIANRVISFSDTRYLEEATRINPAVLPMITEYINKEKPTLLGEYNGKKHLVYMMDENFMEPPNIYFSIESRDMLPNATDFYARMIGIVNFIVNPPLNGMPSLIFKPVILALPWENKPNG